MITSLLKFLFFLSATCYFQYRLSKRKPVFLRFIVPAIAFITSIVLCIGLSPLANRSAYELTTADGVTQTFDKKEDLHNMTDTLDEQGVEYKATYPSESMFTVSTNKLVVLFVIINSITLLLLSIAFFTSRAERNANQKNKNM